MSQTNSFLSNSQDDICVRAADLVRDKTDFFLSKSQDNICVQGADLMCEETEFVCSQNDGVIAQALDKVECQLMLNDGNDETILKSVVDLENETTVDNRIQYVSTRNGLD